MAKYNVYGIGNALVDFDFEVSEETLQRLSIEKGVVTLIDMQQEQQLLEDLDGIKHVKACGGSAANSIQTAQQLGAKCFYACNVSEDATGDFFLEDMHRSGVDTNLMDKEREDGITGKCIAMITPDAERTMNTFLGVASNLTQDTIVESALKESEILYLEGFLVSSPESLETLKYAKQKAQEFGIKTAFCLADVNMVRHFREGLDAILEDGVDILFCNNSEARLYAGTDTVDEAAEYLQKFAKTILITCNDQGVILIDDGVRHDVPAYKVCAVDTIGAGDIFAGSYLYSVCHGIEPKVACDIACFAAAEVVIKFGPRLDNHGIQKTVQHIRTVLQKQEPAGA